jgi:hypothetical protein
LLPQIILMDTFFGHLSTLHTYSVQSLHLG